MCIRDRISSFMDRESAKNVGAFYMIDKASTKRFEGWPLDSLSISKETGRYFVEGSDSESKENIISVSYTHLDVYKRQLLMCRTEMYWEFESPFLRL